MVYILLSVKRRAYFCKSIAIEMGGVSRYFSKALGSGVDVTLLNHRRGSLSCALIKETKSCDPSIPPEEFLGPSGPKLETEFKMSSQGCPALGPKKLKTESKKSQNVEIQLFFNSFLTKSRFSGRG